MENTKIKYGLRSKKTKKILGYREESNDGCDFCQSISTYLDEVNDRMWLVDLPENAEFVRQCSTSWYNAGYDTPSHEYDAEELEVVEVKIVTEIKPKTVKIPTIEEYLAIKYKKSDPEHYEFCMKELKENPKEFFYDLYDLMELKKCEP